MSLKRQHSSPDEPIEELWWNLDEGYSSWQSKDASVRVALTDQIINVQKAYQDTMNTKSGAVVMFSGCTRDTSMPEGTYVGTSSTRELDTPQAGHEYTVTNGDAAVEKDQAKRTKAAKSAKAAGPPDELKPLPVASLTYIAYAPLALKTLSNIATSIQDKYGLQRINITHRLGEVPTGEESVVIVVGAAHRQEGWRAGEEALEEVKKRVEIWKFEVFHDSDKPKEVWRSNEVDRARKRKTVEEGEGEPQEGEKKGRKQKKKR
ncbi:MAG: hypothetical protein Q9162_004438 [Coniocarpon cinnabarinum]